MRRFTIAGILTATLLWGGLAVGPASACGDINEHIEESLSSDLKLAEAGRKELRSIGQIGVTFIGRRLDAIQTELQTELTAPRRSELTALHATLVELIDEVGQQKYCSYSRLYWYTDLAEAQAAALRTHRPILSLRMLGKLTEDLSCANSRFFRVALYANAEVSTFLRETFVLHWQSVRAIPRVTVDFGDGRRIERTITGNSIHYVLTPTGHVVDGLPGLYAPQEFRERLTVLAKLATREDLESTELRSRILADFHRGETTRVQSIWNAATPTLRPAPAQELFQIVQVSAGTPQLPPGVAAVPLAVNAAALARPKSAIETPMIAAFTRRPANISAATDEDWLRLAAERKLVVKLDAASRRLIREQRHFSLEHNGAPSIACGGPDVIDEAAIERMITAFEWGMTIDTLRNEFVLHRALHEWLGAVPNQNLDVLNDRVYAELFLSPGTDPWLGLLAPEAYTAIPQAGVK